jgi:cellulose synthase/poly-beta-1,6-N-acetylglucosamine synthase-like glycosyltransferase
MKKNFTFTVGITTHYGEDSIIKTVKSVRASKGVENFRFIIVADSVPINPTLKKNLKKYDVELIENKTESGQIKKKKQILERCKTDIIIFTQDDVIFESNTISKIMKAFEKNPRATFVSVHNEPVKATSFVEDIVSVGTKIGNRIAKYWNSSDNYLSVVGRCEAFRTDFAKKHFRFIDKVVSTDAFFYFENKKNGGKHIYLKDAKLYFKNPKTLEEHKEVSKEGGSIAKTARVKLENRTKKSVSNKENYLNEPEKEKRKRLSNKSR